MSRLLAALALSLPFAAGAAAAPEPEPPRGLVAMAAAPADLSSSWGAIYAPATGAADGLAMRASRAEAQEAAAALCGKQGQACRLVAEFAGRCGAVAQAVDRSVLMALRPRDGGAVRATAAAGGATEAAAGQAALERCGQEGLGVCVVAAAACAPPEELPAATAGAGGRQCSASCAKALARWLMACFSAGSISPKLSAWPFGMNIGS